MDVWPGLGMALCGVYNGIMITSSSPVPVTAMPALWALQVGTRVHVTLTNGQAYDMVISQRSPAGTYGVAESAGPRIVAHIRPGGYSVLIPSAEVVSVVIGATEGI